MTGYDNRVGVALGGVERHTREQAGYLKDVSDGLTKLVAQSERAAENHPLNDRDEEAPLIRVATALERIAVALEPEVREAEAPGWAGDDLRVVDADPRMVADYRIVDAVNGRKVTESDDLPSLEWVCATLNSEAGRRSGVHVGAVVPYLILNREGKRVES